MIKVNQVSLDRYVRYMNKLCNAKVGPLLEAIERELESAGIQKTSPAYRKIRKMILDSFNEFRREAVRGLIR